MLAGSCGPDARAPADDHAANRTLVWEQPADTLPNHLIARQRALFQSILNGERTTTANYLELGFVWQALRVTLDHRGDPLAKWGMRKDLSYWAIIGGTVPPELVDAPTRFYFSALPRQPQIAAVTAESPASGTRLFTVWRYGSAEWRALRTEAWVPNGR
jgi:hypothetical protein